MDKVNAHKFKATGSGRAMKLIMESEQFSGKCQNITVRGGPFSPYTPRPLEVKELVLKVKSGAYTTVVCGLSACLHHISP